MMWGKERYRHVSSVRVAVAVRTSLSVVVARAQQTVSCPKMHHRHSAHHEPQRHLFALKLLPFCPAELALHIPSLL